MALQKVNRLHIYFEQVWANLSMFNMNRIPTKFRMNMRQCVSPFSTKNDIYRLEAIQNLDHLDQDLHYATVFQQSLQRKRAPVCQALNGTLQLWDWCFKWHPLCLPHFVTPMPTA
eukprot:3477857-Ditylum_brightwellii.AAC.1